jgi:hypothetical protein
MTCGVWMREPGLFLFEIRPNPSGAWVNEVRPLVGQRFWAAAGLLPGAGGAGASAFQSHSAVVLVACHRPFFPLPPLPKEYLPCFSHLCLSYFRLEPAAMLQVGQGDHMESPIIIESVTRPKRRRREPASAHQIAVNRANAARSTGPNTPEGKASSSQNAIKHGLAASRFTVVRVEDPAQLQELHANLLHCYQPVNTQEIEALDCMARARLSMRRAAQLEASLFTTSINDALADPRIRMEPELEGNISVSVDQNRGFYLAEGIRMLAKESIGLSLLLRYQAHAERQYRRALEEFERLKKLRAEMPNEPISENPFPGELKRDEVLTPPDPQTPLPGPGPVAPDAGPDPQPPIPDPQPTGGPGAAGGAGGLRHRPSDTFGARCSGASLGCQRTNGSTRRTPACAKSARFRVATAKSWTAAVAAMRLSLIGMAFPVLRRRASNSAHFRPVSASQGKQWRRPTPRSNQCSRAVRFLPFGRIRIPNRSSPRMTGSTAMSRSCARSHSMTAGSGLGFVGSLRTLASTKYFTTHPSTQILWVRRSPLPDRRGASR